MWIEKAKEAKKSKNMSNKAISMATNGRLAERDVARLLNGEYKKPFVDDVIALGEAVGLSPQELFGETSAVIVDASSNEITELRTKNAELSEKTKMLEITVEWQDKMIKVYEKLLGINEDSETRQE